MQTKNPCRIHNGTYTCGLERGHDGLHIGQHLFKGQRITHTFKDAYSPVRIPSGSAAANKLREARG